MADAPENVIRQQLVLGCTAIHEQHGFQSDAAHDCHAPEADAALAELTAKVERYEAALREAKSELGVPSPNYPAPVANAVGIINAALAADTPPNRPVVTSQQRPTQRTLTNRDTPPSQAVADEASRVLDERENARDDTPPGDRCPNNCTNGRLIRGDINVMCPWQGHIQPTEPTESEGGC